MDNWFETLVSPFIFLLAFGVALGLAYAFRRQLGELLRAFRIKRIGALGVNVEFDLDRVADAYVKQGLGAPSADDLRKIRDAAEHLVPLARGRRVLWVDDNPTWNRLERETMLDWRIEVQTRRDTDAAVDELTRRDERYDLVISDWTRDKEEEEADEEPAGLALARRMREENVHVPLVYYHGLVSSEALGRRRAAATAVGALGATGSPGELYRIVLLELARRTLEVERPTSSRTDDRPRRPGRGR